MADTDWQKVRKVFDDALRQKPEDRKRFVSIACGGDETLRAEVDSLFASLDGAESFMEVPAVAGIPGIIEGSGKRLEEGDPLGHYEIVRPIGAGGMGEVYLARDKKLNRQVAVKVLNEKLSGDNANLQRFIREAKAASALNHPNILVIHEIGESQEAHFIVSEYIKGKTLRESLQEGSLELSEVLDIAVQITRALVAAHDANLVHRDIKPENIMIRPDGVVKVLDFGLAKLLEQKNKSVLGLEDATAQQNPTAMGMILGTVAYMSPEQSRGEQVDARTDIFSLGTLLYEMLTGEQPFTGETTSHTIVAILETEPPPLSLFRNSYPPEVERIIKRCLAKKPDERYRAAKALLDDLKELKEELAFQSKLDHKEPSPAPVIIGEQRSQADRSKPERPAPTDAGNSTGFQRSTTGDTNLQTTESQGTLPYTVERYKPLAAFVAIALVIGAIGLGYYFFDAGNPGSTAGDKKSIAVLPFKPLNADSRDEALEMGMAETLITRLSNLKQVIVRPMSAVRKYTDLQQDSVKAGQELQTEVVLDGSIQKAGDRVRVTVRLINTHDGTSLWSEQFDENFTDIFKMQDSIAERITSALAIRLSRQEKEQLAKHQTDSPEAYQLYLQGEYLWLNRRKDNLSEQSLTYYQRALEKDPNFALAYIGIADYYIRESNKNIPGREAESKARSNIMKALEIDDTLAEAHNALAELKYQYEYDWAGAERDFKKAIELNPNVASIHLGYGWFLMSASRFDEAAIEMDKAREFDPSSLTAKVAKGRLFYFSRQYDQALQHFQNIIAVEPNSPSSYFSLSQIYLQKQMYTEYLEVFTKHLELIAAPPEEIEGYQRSFKTSGFLGMVRKAQEDMETRAKTQYVSPVLFALLNIHLGQKDEAIAWLEKAFNDRHPNIVQLKIDPEFDSLRDDPRFQDLMRRIGLLQ